MRNNLNTIIVFATIFIISSCNSKEAKEMQHEAKAILIENNAIATEDLVQQNQSPDTLAYCINDGIGLGGYDAVSYFTSNAALNGDENISTTYKGVKYIFSNDQNKDLFISDPEKYLPVYGGWCAMTLSMGRATTPVYDNFLIDDGKLHLFERTVSVNGRTLWQQDPQTNAQRAQKHYNDYKKDGIISVEE